MRLRRQAPGLALPGALFLFFTGLYACCNAAPIVVPGIGKDGSARTVWVTGKDFPRVSALTLTFAYDSSVINASEAIASSPIPSTAFGASLDPVNQKLSITVQATSSFAVNDGDELVKLSIPDVSSSVSPDALTLTEATCLDAHGNTVMVQIEPAAQTILPSYRPSEVSSGTHRQTSTLSAAVLANGRKSPIRANRPSGIVVNENEKISVRLGR